MAFNLWSGKLFPTFEASSYSTDHHFTSEEYLNKIRERFNGSSNKSEINPLNLVISFLSRTNRNINVLDFGGGFGSAILHAKEFSSNKVNINYLNIDNERIIKIFLNDFACKEINNVGSTLINNQEKEKLFGVNNRVDVLLLGSVIQYVEKEVDLIKLLCHEYNPRYIILDDVYLAERSFITTQIFYDYHEVPFKFIDKRVISKILEEIKGRIVFMSDKIPIFNGKEEFYNVDNLPDFGKITRTKTIFIEI